MAGRDSGVGDEFEGTERTGDGPVFVSPPAPGAGTGSGSGTGPEPFDPRIHVAADAFNGDGSRKRKPGRRSGAAGSARPRPTTADLKSSVEALTATLVIVHAGLAAATSTPELEIDKPEATLLASSAADLMAQFDVAPDPKTRAIIGMIMACGTVYGPRAVMIRMRKAQEREEKPAGSDGLGTAGVFDVHGFGVGTTGFVATPATDLGARAVNTPPPEQWPTKQ